MAEKVTEMLLKVHDLQCSKCYKKVKKILSKFPQIQEQVYDEKNNTVRIKVVCCCPEKIRDKIRCKGRGIIKCIVIVEPPQPPPPPPHPPIAAAGSGAKATATANATAPEVKIDDKTTIEINFFDVPKPHEKHKKPEKPKTPEEPKKTEEHKKAEKPITPEVKKKDENTIEINFELPKPWYVDPCSCGCGGHGGHCGRTVCSCGCGGFGRHCRRTVCSCGCGGFGGHCGRPVCSCGCGGYRSHCEYYFCEDNSQGCTIM